MKKNYRSLIQKLALIIWAVIIILAIFERDKITADAIISYTPSNIWLAVLMLLGGFALKTLSVVFYSGLLFTVSGMMFDLPFAIAVNIAGAMVMLLEGYVIGHAGGHELVTELSAKYPKFAAFTGIKDDHPFAFALLIRMLKVVNYDIGSMYMGASGVRLFPYLAGSLTALMPELVLFALAGSGISNMNAVPAAAAAVIYIGMTLISAALLRVMMNNSQGMEQK
jgi:uncharacterized membrane protein YdjX (TVP38/TMEM64 family)